MKLTTEIKRVLENCKNLQVLYMAECDLTSLDHFPLLDKLDEFDVSSNSLKDQDIKHIISCCKNITTLSIGDNNITSLDTIKQLKALKELEILNCDDTPVASEANYAKTAFEHLKKLKYLDSKDKDGKEIAFEDLKGEAEDEEDDGEDDGEEDEEDE